MALFRLMLLGEILANHCAAVLCPPVVHADFGCDELPPGPSTCDSGCYDGYCLGLYQNVGSIFFQQQCPAGSACEGGSSCASTLCDAGTYSLPGSSNCSSCPPGTLTPPGSPFCGPPCPAGTWSNGGAACALCPAGTSSSAAGTSSSASCAPCAAGLVAPAPGSVLCAPCPPNSTSAPDRASCVPALSASASPSASQSPSGSATPTPSETASPTTTPSASGSGRAAAAAAPQPAPQYAALGASAGVALGVSLLGAVAWPLLLSRLQLALRATGKGAAAPGAGSLNAPLFAGSAAD